MSRILIQIKKIKIDKKSHKNILIYYIGSMTPNSVKPLYVIVNNADGYIEESNGNKHLTLFATDEDKNELKKYEEICSKIKDIRSTNNSSDDYDEK